MHWQQIESAGLTDPGMRRANNQDCFALVPAVDESTWARRGHLFLVADGMGAHAVGELASRLAADLVPHTYHKLPGLSPAEAIRKALEEANTRIHQRGEQNRDFRGMGTTTTALALLPQGALIGHVGDSRVYRVRDGRIEQLSFDHSLAWELIRHGRMSTDQAGQFVPRNVITRSLGPEAEVNVDVEGPYPTRPGDVYILCSDGLSGPVHDEEIGVVAGNLEPEPACRTLIDLANLRGGPDNITVVVVRIPAEPADSTAPAGRRVPDLLRRGWFWAALYLAAIVAGEIALTALGQLFLAVELLLVAGAAAALTAAVSIRRRQRRRDAAPETNKAPYRTADCRLTPHVIGQLASLERQLREVAVDEDWPIEWPTYERQRQAAEAAAAEQRWAEALRQYCEAIHLLATELRDGSKTFQIKVAGA